MTRTYNCIDADGHILEPLELWADYIDPAYRDHAPRLVRDDRGKERLLIGEKMLGSEKGLGALGAVGARDGVVVDDALEYKDGRKGGFDPHTSTRPSASSPGRSRTRKFPPQSAALTIAGWPTTASPILIVCSASP
jgi:hypothetical protein